MGNVQRRIFIVEDELLYLELIITACQKIGWEVISARTVDESIALLEEMQGVDLKPLSLDAFWIDHYLPGKNGDELIRYLQSKKEFSSIPFFLVTNAVENKITNWYVHAGAKQVYTKMTATPPKIIADIDLFLQRFPTTPNPSPMQSQPTM